MSMRVDVTMSIEEIIETIKTNVMYLSNGWDSANSDEDARLDFDSVCIIGFGLDLIKEQMLSKDESLRSYKKRCLDLIAEKNELKMKLESVKKAAE